MNPEIKARWVSALRSGEFLQGGGALKKYYPARGASEHCCLGVYCELAAAAGHATQEPYTPHREFVAEEQNLMKFKDLIGVGDAGFPTDLLMGWGGLDLQSAHLLASMNDEGKSFAEIADWIEANL